jgi:hypothetical protein
MSNLFLECRRRAGTLAVTGIASIRVHYVADGFKWSSHIIGTREGGGVSTDSQRVGGKNKVELFRVADGVRV